MPTLNPPMRAVYLLDEVFQMAQGGIQDVGAIVQFVVTRLTARQPIVKQKARRPRSAGPTLPMSPSHAG